MARVQKRLDLSSFAPLLRLECQLHLQLFDERNPAVLKIIAKVIEVAKKTGRKVGVCGQSPSDYPEFVDLLVEQGIDSISLTPDVIIKTTLNTLAAERRMK
ncbi:MAG: pyruvate,water dikinase [Pirellulaceae bacterium]